MTDGDGYPYKAMPSESIKDTWKVTGQQSARYRYVAYLGTQRECEAVAAALNGLRTKKGC